MGRVPPGRMPLDAEPCYEALREGRQKQDGRRRMATTGALPVHWAETAHRVPHLSMYESQQPQQAATQQHYTGRLRTPTRRRWIEGDPEIGDTDFRRPVGELEFCSARDFQHDRPGRLRTKLRVGFRGALSAVDAECT